tara:strand:- start:876 stop:1091 length:216 start_codon:yes stop_codon:yes gene_type:complete
VIYLIRKNWKTALMNIKDYKISVRETKAKSPLSTTTTKSPSKARPKTVLNRIKNTKTFIQKEIQKYFKRKA